MNKARQARLGRACFVNTGRGAAKARQDVAGVGEVRRGKVGSGASRRSKVSQARYGEVWRVDAGKSKAGGVRTVESSRSWASCG